MIFWAEDGSEVHAHDIRPKKGIVPAGFADYLGQDKIKKVPPFYTISATISCAEDSQMVLEDGGAADLEVSDLVVTDGVLTAQVTNSSGEELVGLVVTLELLSGDDTIVKQLELEIGTLADGASQEVSQEIGEVDFAAFAFSYAFGE